MKQITIIEERTGLKYELIKIADIRVEQGVILLFGDSDMLIGSFPSDKYAFFLHLKDE